ncbi:MAG: LD-carboxypeptidase [Bacteroidales bacterium]|nr:LD-carboxypeptidase [Bacteroidales bacterium]
MNKPLYLKSGDKVGVISPGKSLSVQTISFADNLLGKWGLEVIMGKNIDKSYNQFAGTDDERAKDLQEMLDDKSIKAILCSRGGYGTIRIIEKLNFKNFIKYPKWIVGYSDITVLHSYLNKILNFESIHGVMPINFPENIKDNESTESLKRTLFGQNPEYTIKSHKLNRKGKASGILVGGNLSILYSLRGTKLDLDYKGKILFIEDIDEYLYHIDRIMLNLKLGGILAGLKGMIIGGMTNMKDNEITFGKSAYEIIHEAISEYNFPVCFNFNAGHIEPNLTLILGRKIVLDVKQNEVEIEFNQ